MDFAAPEKQVFADGRTGTEITQLTSTGENSHPYHYEESFTPDDGWIVYNSSRSGGCQWWKMSTDDGSSVRLTDSAPPTVGLSMTGDGRFGYCGDGPDYFRVDLQEGGCEQVWRNDWDAAHFGGAKVSPDGKRLVTGHMSFLDDDRVELPGQFRSHLVVVNSDGTDARIILESDERGLAHPIWAHHDTGLIAINSQHKGLPFGHHQQPEVIRCDGTGHRELFPRNPWDHDRVPLVESNNFLFGCHNCWDHGADTDRLILQQQVHLPVPGPDDWRSGKGGLAADWMYCAVGWLGSVGADGSDWRIEAFYPYARTGHTGVDHHGRYLAFDPVDSEVDPDHQLIVVADRRSRENHVIAALPRQFSRLPADKRRPGERWHEDFIGGEHTHCRPTFSRDDRYLIFSSDYGLGAAQMYLVDLSQFDWWRGAESGGAT